jgi:hypothetical protein
MREVDKAVIEAAEKLADNWDKSTRSGNLWVYINILIDAVHALREAGEQGPDYTLREAAQRVVDINNSEYGPPPTPLSLAIENLWAVLESDKPQPSPAEAVGRLEAEIDRLNAAKSIVLGKCEVIVANAQEEGKGIENEVLILDAEGRSSCIGQPFDELKGERIFNHEPRLLARLVVAHPDGVDVLVEKLESASEAYTRKHGLEV